eukprot:4790589-Alexandrium_andersonii.AAC.1
MTAEGPIDEDERVADAVFNVALESEVKSEVDDLQVTPEDCFLAALQRVSGSSQPSRQSSHSACFRPSLALSSQT